MHRTTLVAGIIIVAVTLSVLFYSAAITTISSCIDNAGAQSSATAFESLTACNAVYFAPHILSFSVGLWLIVFGVMSRSARPVLTNAHFIHALLACGGAIWALVVSIIIASSLEQATSFGPPNPWITPFTFNPLQMAATGAGLILLGLAGYVIKKSANPARILMWVLTFVAVVFVAEWISEGNTLVVLASLAGTVGVYFLLRKRPIPSIAIAAVVMLSVAGILLSTQNEEIQGYYPEQTPDVSFVRGTEETPDIDGIKLVKMTNSSRTLGPDCISDSSCVKSFGEGLAELALSEGLEGDLRVIAATITNKGINPINVTRFDITGLVLAGNGKPQYLEARAVRDPNLPIITSILAPREEISKGSVMGPVTIQVGESFTAYMKGQWTPYAESGADDSPFPFQAQSAYEYWIEPSVRTLDDSISCVEYCPSAYPHISMNLHKGYWSLTAGNNFREITQSYVNILSQYSYSDSMSNRLSYAGCMSVNDALNLYTKRNITLGFPQYLPAELSLICILDENGSPSLVQVYGNTSAAGIQDYIDDDPRLIFTTSATEPGSLVIAMTMALTPNQYNNSAFARVQELRSDEGPSSIDHFYVRKIPGGSVFVEGFDGGAVAVDLNLVDRQYHVFGKGVSEEELVKVAESIRVTRSTTG